MFQENQVVKHYKAYWSPVLIIMSTLLTALCLGLALTEFGRHGPAAWVGWLLVALIIGCALFSIRGYTVAPEELLVHRLRWSTRVPLADL
jgi:hypothetical protein